MFRNVFNQSRTKFQCSIAWALHSWTYVAFQNEVEHRTRDTWIGWHTHKYFNNDQVYSGYDFEGITIVARSETSVQIHAFVNNICRQDDFKENWLLYLCANTLYSMNQMKPNTNPYLTYDRLDY